MHVITTVTAVIIPLFALKCSIVMAMDIISMHGKGKIVNKYMYII